MQQYSHNREDQTPFAFGNNSAANGPAVKRSSSTTSTRSRNRGHPSPHPNGVDPSNPTITPPTGRRSEIPEGVANLNRWSRSESSSRETTPARHSRRMSSGTFSFGNTEDKASPKRLQKTRPSTSASPSPARQSQSTRPAESSKSISTQLPPLLTLPGLQTTSLGSRSPLDPSPSTAGLLSAAVRSTVPDYFAAWEPTSRDAQRRDRSQSRSINTESSVGPPTSRLNKGALQVRGEDEDGHGRSPEKGHSRNRSGKSSGGSARSSKHPGQKAMLSKALQKANTAVLLDNAQNFEGAVQAYSEACALLQQVMSRSSGDEDRRKLEAIRNTYSSRISELEKISPPRHGEGGKALPARPESGTYLAGETDSAEDDEDAAIIETATVTRIVNDSSYTPEYQQSRLTAAALLPRRRESLLPSALESAQSRLRAPLELPMRSLSKSPMRERATEYNSLSLAPPMDSLYMPPPLSPRRPLSPMTHGAPNNGHERQTSSDSTTNDANSGRPSPSKGQTHTRVPSNESMSWLDTIDESGASDDGSSVHSRTSSMGVRRKHIRGTSGATEAEFDAALDAAVEAAYDDGFEPMDTPETNFYDYDEDDEVVANVRRRVELAKERVRQSEREAAVQDAHERERRRRLLQQQQQDENEIGDGFDGNESEEEERMLEEMTSGFVMDDFQFGLQSKSALPRESDSSGFSGRTWHSSIGSNPTTAGTMLSTVSEASMPKLPTFQTTTQPPLNPPPSHALPPPPNATSQPPVSTQGVRGRRLSGQNPKQLKIETTKLPPPLSQPPSLPPPSIPHENNSPQPKTAGLPPRQPMSLMTGRPPMPQSARQASSPFPGPSPAEIVSPPTPALDRTNTTESMTNGGLLRTGSPVRAHSRSGMTKNMSSSSLNNMKSRNLSVSYLDDASEKSPGTPLSSQFSRDPSARLPAMPTLPTPIAVAFKDRMNSAPTGGLYLFDSDITSPISLRSPTLMSGVEGPAIPLEPCPTEYLLRPFWLMRAFYQTIAHPRGGYLSTKLFVPRDVWRVKGVKIKNVEDKIANCDFLTAALLKLSQVDTNDADAVLVEMQALESVLEQVQTVLTKKLGNEVGVQNSGGMFKDAAAIGDSENTSLSKASSLSSKSSSFSWRRLRSKNSAVGLSSNYSSKLTPTEGAKEGLSMATLPMTSTAVSKVRFAKRDVSQVQFSGPNANYMGALARLFDAAQTLDQIARQVEDPGLRHADKTQVGLELCMRHAAEFFGFYVCRFVLNDIGMLLDKFIKRGSEWVLV